MRLLRIKSLEFAEFQEDETPRYVIASHRWQKKSEVTLQDVQLSRNKDKDGYKKIEAFATYIANHIPSIEWLWIDTCCIDRTNAQELTEAINSMLDWYRNAALCIAYLVDVPSTGDNRALKQSEWFRRGWTLQELLAPWTIVFVTQSWKVIGSKGDLGGDEFGAFTGPRLEEVIAQITDIPEHVLHDFSSSQNLSVEARLMWMDLSRKTTREEDMSYALYGIFNVAPGANYAEKYDRARQRLLSAISEQDSFATRQAARVRSVLDYLSAPLPWGDHEKARAKHEPLTGTWLMDSAAYRRWKSGSIRYLWIYGMPGCGKTMLCSEAIEDVRKRCGCNSTLGVAVFYCSSIDGKKQHRIDVLSSLVAQLLEGPAMKGPALSVLEYALNRGLLGVKELENALRLCFEAYTEVFLLLDALDECAESEGGRQDVLEWLARLTQVVPRVRVLATSRERVDIRTSMATLGAEALPIDALSTDADADIRQYVTMALSRDRRLSNLDTRRKTLIVETISAKAGGMYLWANMVLHELKGLKSLRPSNVRSVLSSQPPSVDSMYERMLVRIDASYRMNARTLLRWLVYAKAPPTLRELVEACIIDWTADGCVEVEDRGGQDDALGILSDLVIVNSREQDIDGINHSSRTMLHQSKGDDADPANDPFDIAEDTTIRLAHISVKDYLESRRILLSPAKDFHLESGREHEIMSQSCLVYLMHYSSSEQRQSRSRDFATFPLLRYAAESWYYHSDLQEAATPKDEVKFLCSENNLHDWLRVYQPDRPWETPFGELENPGTSLYYASFLGLYRVVDELLKAGTDVDVQGGHYGNALQAASVTGHEKIVQMLLDEGAEINAVGGSYDNALQAASVKNHEKVVQMLLDAGAEISKA